MHEVAVFGGGCFWCTEAIFQMLRGVTSVTPGYAGGKMANPSWYDVATGTTGHAEVIHVDFEPTVIPYKDLLDVFFHTHNPTSLNRQGADTGTEYRSIILYTSEEQKKIANEMIDQINKSGEFEEKIVTEVKPLDIFHEAEESHKNYYEKNSQMSDPYCLFVISPKLIHLREKYSTKLKE